jgi:hypothetical protein
MIVYIRIDTDNDAFQQNGPGQETARILVDLAKRIARHPNFSPGHDQALLDSNGNEVGFLPVKEE